jgi:hypothetical protein
MRVSLEEVRRWSAADVRLLAAYSAVEPTPDDRILWMLAALRADIKNQWRGQNAKRAEVTENHLFREPWKVVDEAALLADSRYSAVDQSIMQLVMRN